MSEANIMTKHYLPSWPKRSVIERVAEEMQIKQSTKHWTWDGQASRKQSRYNSSKAKAKLDGLVASYLEQMNLDK